jgi:hypothetical protein
MSENSQNQKSGFGIGIVFLLLALLLVAAGYRNNEHQSYFQKAIMVCTQCIGLG